MAEEIGIDIGDILAGDKPTLREQLSAIPKTPFANINISDPKAGQPVLVGDVTVADAPNGDVIVNLDGAGNQIPDFKNTGSSWVSVEKNVNIADRVDSTFLAKMSEALLRGIDADNQSCAGWRAKIKDALEHIGVKAQDRKTLPFDDASNMTHPLIAESMVQFNARAMKETLPATGPVKTVVYGKETQSRRDEADRVQNHMNYQITQEDRAYYDNHDRLMMYLPCIGSAFKLTYYDKIKKTTVSKFISVDDIIVAYNASSMEELPRLTYIDRITHNEFKKRILSNDYIDQHIGEPQDDSEADSGITSAKDAIDKSEGRERSVDYTDNRHAIYNIFVDYDIKGFEHTDVKTGKPTGIGLPWIVQIEKESRKIVGIKRNWCKIDQPFKKEDYITHYKMFSGFGLLGYGYFHLIGGLQAGLTGAVRLILDSSAFASMQGGFKSKDAKLKGGDLRIKPREWVEVNLTSEELSKCFYTPPFKEPSAALFNIAKVLEENGRRFASTTEAVVGDAKNTGPVGTTVALIEQGTQVTSGVHKRIHEAMEHEIQIRARINKEMMDETGYYYNVAGDRKWVNPEDYNDEIKIVPVSDPNIISQTQRIAMAQAELDLAIKFPQYYDIFKVLKSMQSAMGKTNPDENMISPDKAPRLDPMNEGSMIMTGKPVKAFYDQMHDAHIAIHEAQMAYAATLPPEQSQPYVISLQSHIATHRAYAMHAQINTMFGGKLPPIDLYDISEESSIPAELENQLSMLEASNLPLIQQYLAQFQPVPPRDAESDAEIARKDKAFAAEEERKKIAFENEQERKDKQAINDEARKEVSAENQEERGDKQAIQKMAHAEAANESKSRWKEKPNGKRT